MVVYVVAGVAFVKIVSRKCEGDAIRWLALGDTKKFEERSCVESVPDSTEASVSF